MTLNNLERRNGRYFALYHCVKEVEHVAVKKFAFAISSPDEFVVQHCLHNCCRF